MSKLTPTSFALLGFLNYRDWSAYELNKVMQGSIVRASWPRVESRIYTEIKNLEKHQLADSEQQQQGGRKRRVYRINQQGRQALQTWLKSSAHTMRIEYETLLQLAFSDIGEAGLTHALVDRIEQQTLQDLQITIDTCEQTLEQQTWATSATGHLHVLTIKFVNQMTEARLSWARQARSYLDRLDHDNISAQSLAEYRVEVDRLKELLKNAAQ
ncbi:hypothetical protein SIN8267_02480 [Sinobacterium norvegicum]|uniref:Transcription regulator PadR N-terminal domain-containing protein n=1 Tax=Sinobacterium norvegicum TaxID=1641715 RepID=A0ABN8EIT4_9GAMM|nr:PadR family transcriptional regulator [Sinobacterium norvegicum]CAH0992361.1 hypothetical protein SIN8267_02480 [Sinobacterium norvegicum]